jgi:hypothetical protein
MNHIPQETLQRFVEGKATRPECRQIVAHLLRGCDSCRARVIDTYRPTTSEQAYDEVIDRVTRRFVARWGFIELLVPRRASAFSL